MAILPEGFALPPLPYLVVLLVSVLSVAGVLYRDAPPVTERVVVAFAPWMVVGSVLYVSYQIDAVPTVVAPFLGSPAVYLTTFVLLGTLWTALNHLVAESEEGGGDDGAPSEPGSSATDEPGDDSTIDDIPTDDTSTDDSTTTTAATATVLGVGGVVLAVGIVTFALWIGARRGSLRVFWPVVGALVASALAGVTWAVVRRWEVSETGWAGALVVFGHALDGVSTAVGIDILGFGEQTPLARVFLDIGASLPVSEFVGTGWLFVAVKLGLAVGITWLLADTVRERPREGYLLLAFVAAVGLGPGAHNLLLFVVAG